MAKIIGSVPLTGFIAPNDELDTYPVHEDSYGKGGYRVELTLVARDAVTSLRRKEGMLVHVIEDSKTYQLLGGVTNSNWVLFNPLGAASADLSYVHTQGVANAVWNATHNLGKNPSVSVVDSGGSIVEGDVLYVDANNITLTFSSAFSGKAYFN